MKKNIKEIPKSECCGCTACESVCQNRAIKMNHDEQGFLYPYLDETICIDCGKCLRVCKSSQDISKGVYYSYASKNRDDEFRRRSSSGGVAHALCVEIIKRGGVIYGVRVSENIEKVFTCRAASIAECDGFFGSKYVQADLKDTFHEVLNDLSNHKWVLYIATSCHIAGLRSFLDEVMCNIDNLITVDFICHGVPSPLIYRDYIRFLKRNPFKNLCRFDFRTKNRGWGNGSQNFGCTILYKSKFRVPKTLIEETDNTLSRIFLRIFFSNVCLRPKCYSCNFASEFKPSDITIADFWGCKDAHPDFFDDKGVSAVLTPSLKGDDLLKSANLDMIISSIDKISHKQSNMHMHSMKSEKYDEFWTMYSNYGFKAIARKYGGYTIKNLLKDTIIYQRLKTFIGKN